jgi:hypothetical protein
MKKMSAKPCLVLFFIITILTNLVSCKKDENPIKYPKGIFPDSTFALTDINSAYDDYNSNLFQLIDNVILVFSSNRISTGEQFDLVQGKITYFWNQESGVFSLGSEMTQDAFITTIINASNTTGDDLGPYSLFGIADGYEYMLLSSENQGGNLDFYYLKYQPATGTTLPAVLGPYPVTLLNTSSDDAYISFDTNQDSVYLSSDFESGFDIYLKNKPSETSLGAWFDGTYSAPFKVDSINSPLDDKCPFIFRKIMVFASNRPGGIGGYDLYYSIFRKGKWSSPVNFGPDINTTSDEYRPVIGYHEDFTNNFMIFSSNRSGGKGGYDLYFRGITFPK